MLEKLLDAKTTADHIGVTAGCLAKWRLTGAGPCFIKVQRRVMYDPSDIRQWLAERRATSTSEIS